MPLAGTGTVGKGTTIGEGRSTVWHYVRRAGTARLSSTAPSGRSSVDAYHGDTTRSACLAHANAPYDA